MVLTINNLVIDTPLSLAPMVGLSHSALRTIVKKLGGVGLLYTEMLSAKRLPSENEKCSPFLVRGRGEAPLFYQIYLGNISELESAVERLVELDAQGIDINLGCPAPQLRKVGAGQFLLRHPDNVIAMCKKLRQLTDLPISVKIRLGATASNSELLSSCLKFQDLGIDLITVHARLDKEKFCRKPRWHILEKVIPYLSVPVFVNGGIFSVEDARNCLEQSGAAGLMIGRGAAIKPWLLKEIAVEVYGLADEIVSISKETIYFDFIKLLEERFPEERRLGRLKQFTHYYSSNYQFGHVFAARIQSSKTMEQAVNRAKDFLQKAA